MVNDAKSEVARERMAVMTKTCDGFIIAEADLTLRGPGEFLGLRQHGLPTFRAASFAKDAKLIEQAKIDAESFLASGPNWQSPELTHLNEYLQRQLKSFN